MRNAKGFTNVSDFGCITLCRAQGTSNWLIASGFANPDGSHLPRTIKLSRKIYQMPENMYRTIQPLSHTANLVIILILKTRTPTLLSLSPTKIQLTDSRYIFDYINRYDMEKTQMCPPWCTTPPFLGLHKELALSRIASSYKNFPLGSSLYTNWPNAEYIIPL